LQIAQRSPGCTTLPPSAGTCASAPAMSGTSKYGSEKESPGPRPRAWTPTVGDSPRSVSLSSPLVCQPSP
jgi:hypothetical protein